MRISDWSSDVCSSDLYAAQADVFHFQEIVYAVDRAFTAQARLLDAAKRRHLVGDQARIDPDHAVFERLGHPENTAYVAAVKVRCQAVFGVVGQFDHVIFVGEFDDRGERPERFLVHAQHVLGDIRDDGGLEEARSEEHTSELQSLMRISYAVFGLKNKKN